MRTSPRLIQDGVKLKVYLCHFWTQTAPIFTTLWWTRWKMEVLKCLNEVRILILYGLVTPLFRIFCLWTNIRRSITIQTLAIWVVKICFGTTCCAWSWSIRSSLASCRTHGFCPNSTMNSKKWSRFRVTNPGSSSSSQPIPAVAEASEWFKAITGYLKQMNRSFLPTSTGHCSSKGRSSTCECMSSSPATILCAFTYMRKALLDSLQRITQMTPKYWGTSLCISLTFRSIREMSRTMLRMMAGVKLPRCQRRQSLWAHRTWPPRQTWRAAAAQATKSRTQANWMRIQPKSLHRNGV